jgi:hypothetical protein
VSSFFFDFSQNFFGFRDGYCPGYRLGYRLGYKFVSKKVPRGKMPLENAGLDTLYYTQNTEGSGFP